MTRVRIDLFSSLDGYTAAHDSSADNPMGEDGDRSPRHTRRTATPAEGVR